MMSLNIKYKGGIELILGDTMRYKINQIKNNQKELSISNYMKDYAKTQQNMEKRIDRGFIKQTFSGAPFMKANKYGFSDKWKLYGTDDFYIPEEDKRYKKKR